MKAKATPKERPSTRMWYVGFKSSNLSMPSCGVSQYHPISTKAGAPRNSHASLGHVVRGEASIELPSTVGSGISSMLLAERAPRSKRSIHIFSFVIIGGFFSSAKDISGPSWDSKAVALEALTKALGLQDNERVIGQVLSGCVVIELLRRCLESVSYPV